MSPILICILIIVIEALVIALLIFILVMVIKGKRQKRIAEDNKRILEADKLKEELDKKGEFYESQIKDAKTGSDFLAIRNNILSNYGNKD